LRAAEQECRNHNHYYVGAEHMLFALVEEHDAGVEARLRERNLASSDIHAAIKRAFGMGEDRMWEGILVTPRVRKIVAIAEKRAGDGEIEPVHLFDAICDEGAGLAADLLSRLARNSPEAPG
jgi:ATP-dependent Clp protease ATP-binding subunit ClpA